MLKKNDYQNAVVLIISNRNLQSGNATNKLRTQILITSTTLLVPSDTSTGHGEENHEETQRIPSCLQFHFADNLK